MQFSHRSQNGYLSRTNQCNLIVHAAEVPHRLGLFELNIVCIDLSACIPDTKLLDFPKQICNFYTDIGIVRQVGILYYTER